MAVKAEGMTDKKRLETLLGYFGIGFKSHKNRVVLEEGCGRVDVLGSFMYCAFEFDDDGRISHVDIGE
jgi:hypothetical protein